jgi:nucleoid-associated protein YgaU
MSDEQGGGGAPTDEERARALREQLKSLHAFDLAYDMMEGLVTFGYQKMGLTDATSELRDLGDARLTIELLRANLEVVERELGEDHTLALHSTLAQMQLGYAQAVQLAGRAPAARPQAAEPAAEEPAAATKPAPKKAAARKPAAKKAAARKPAAKKAAAKKPAAKKAAPKKPAAKKPRSSGTSPA